MSCRSSHRDLAAALAQAYDELRRSEREIRNLRRENEILREAAAPLIHQAAARERFAFIHAWRGQFSVKLLCRTPATDHANYFAWARTLERRRAREDNERRLTELILEVHTAHPAYEST